MSKTRDPLAALCGSDPVDASCSGYSLPWPSTDVAGPRAAMTDFEESIDKQPVDRFEWGVFAICMAIALLDGFDVVNRLSQDFAQPKGAILRTLEP
jgi:hypothetical protein